MKPLILFIAGTIALSAQWVPASATLRETHYRLQPDGTRIVVKDLRGTLIRASDGSTRKMLQPFHANGPTGLGKATIHNVSTGLILELDYGTRSSRVSGEIAVPFLPRKRDNIPAGRMVEERTINGLLCKGIEVRGSIVLSGTAWFSVESDLPVLEETYFVGDLVLVRELSDIQLNVEPSREVFEVPAGFAQLDSRGNVR